MRCAANRKSNIKLFKTIMTNKIEEKKTSILLSLEMHSAIQQRALDSQQELVDTILECDRILNEYKCLLEDLNNIFAKSHITTSDLDEVKTLLKAREDTFNKLKQL